MPVGPAQSVRILLESFPLTAPPVLLLEAVTNVVLEEGWEDHRNFALERAEKWLRRVDKQLRSSLNDLEEVGRPARLAYNSSARDVIQGACFAEPTDSPEVHEQKLRRSRLGVYLQIIRSLSPEEFELLCARLIGLFGVQAPAVTRRVADEGIDFYGRLDGGSVFFPQDLQPTIQKQLSIWLVGQAKQYIGTQAGTPEIRDLVGAVTLGKANAGSTDISAFPDLDIRVSDPVFSLLVTGGTLSSRAWKLLRRSGVVGIDGELLAAFLADRDAGPGADPEPETFRAWLSEAI